MYLFHLGEERACFNCNLGSWNWWRMVNHVNVDRSGNVSWCFKVRKMGVAKLEKPWKTSCLAEFPSKISWFWGYLGACKFGDHAPICLMVLPPKFGCLCRTHAQIARFIQMPVTLGARRWWAKQRPDDPCCLAGCENEDAQPIAIPCAKGIRFVWGVRYSYYCWWFRNPGSTHQLRLIIYPTIFFLRVWDTSQVGDRRISETSTVSFPILWLSKT